MDPLLVKALFWFTVMRAMRPIGAGALVGIDKDIDKVLHISLGSHGTRDETRKYQSSRLYTRSYVEQQS